MAVSQSQAGIYAIRNRVNGQEYIGQSVHIATRWQQHRTGLRGGYQSNQHLQRAWNRYGENAFLFVLLEAVSPPTKEALAEREQHYIDTRKPAYNQRPAAVSNLGHRFSEQVRANMSAGKKRLLQNPTPALRAAWERLREMEPTQAQRDYWERRRGVPWTAAQRECYTPRVGADRTPAQKARDERLRTMPMSAVRRASYAARREQLQATMRLAHAANRGSTWSAERRAADQARRAQGLTERQREGYARRTGREPTSAQRAYWERLRTMEPTPEQLAYWESLKGRTLPETQRAKMSAAQYARNERERARRTQSPHQPSLFD